MYSMASVDDMMQVSAYPLNRLNPIEVEPHGRKGSGEIKTRAQATLSI